METSKDTKPHWTTCAECRGQGRVTTSVSRKKRRAFQIALNASKTSGDETATPKSLSRAIHACPSCAGSGLISSQSPVPADGDKYPNVAIIGGGIGGTALAVACLHRGIPFTLYEQDESFAARSQGYGLTLQQASKAVEALGIVSLPDGITSTRHVVHTPDGNIIGEWGLRKWKTPFIEKTTKRKNVHVARQTFRLALLEQLGASKSIKWGYTLTELSPTQVGSVNLTFQVGEKRKNAEADLVVGADGIRSKVRAALLEESSSPLQYLDCMVILGICPLESLPATVNPLLDSATVFQTVNGHERIYVMPYNATTIMWQASFPMSETKAKALSAKGAHAMKEVVLKRFAWHTPIPQMLAATSESKITGYPVYDRAIFDPAALEEKGNVTLLGDAAHPMSPFKGQGANQAILDALALARKITVTCDENPQWRDMGIRKSILTAFEREMAKRSGSKVEDSKRAVTLLHSNAVLHQGDTPRGR